MNNNGELARPSESRAWTRAEDYVGAMARRRTERRKRELRTRTQPERPRLLLSTLPFVTLIAALAVIGVAIFALAWPGADGQPLPRRVVQQEQGYAPKGWFQEAEKEFR